MASVDVAVHTSEVTATRAGVVRGKDCHCFASPVSHAPRASSRRAVAARVAVRAGEVTATCSAAFRRQDAAASQARSVVRRGKQPPRGRGEGNRSRRRSHRHLLGRRPREGQPLLREPGQSCAAIKQPLRGRGEGSPSRWRDRNLCVRTANRLRAGFVRPDLGEPTLNVERLGDHSTWVFPTRTRQVTLGSRKGKAVWASIRAAGSRRSICCGRRGIRTRKAVVCKS